jgi:hypothetical protein
VFTEPLLINGHLLWFCYSSFSRHVTMWNIMNNVNSQNVL